MKSSLAFQSYQTSASESESPLILGNDPNVLLEDEEDNKKSIFIFSFIARKFRAGSVPQGALSLIAATIGTGILMISNSLAPSGLIWSSLQMAFCAGLTYYTLLTLTRCADDADAYSYQELALKAFGDWFRHVVNFCCFFANWGSAILFLQLSCELFAVVAAAYGGNHLPDWLTNPESKPLIVLQATLFVLPLALPKELKALRYFTFANLCLLVLFCYAVIYEGFDYHPITESFQTTRMFTFSGFSTTFPSAVFTMTSHTNAIDIFRELKYPTVKNMKKVITLTVIFALTAYLTVGLIGYATFSSNLSILSDQNYANSVITVAYGYTLEGAPRSYPLLIIVNMITMCASIIISQPFNIKPARDSLRNSLRTVFKKFGLVESDSSTDEETTFERYIYVLVTLYSAVLVVLFFDNAQTVMNILGASFFSLLCFVFPSMFYLKIHKDDISRKHRIIHWTIVIANVLLAGWATVGNIIQII